MDVFDLFAKIKLDSSGYEKGLNAAKELGNKVASGMATAFKVSTAAITAAGTAVAGLTKQSLSAVANYEQLVGGVDKIFGEASKKVQEYANQAYTTAGLSANQYMETVTSFSASLLQSLGGDTEKAADAANRAIIDMSDNVNTYGSSMESVMNAYQGFSKQNYTMLDNLKLGYGGTKEEMERLVADAASMDVEMGELGVTVDADSLSFGNIVNAISVMQKHMKIAGTTTKEAGSTISGSVASMKAAWQNFLTGTGSPAQFTEVLTTSIGNIKKNLKEIVPRLMDGLSELADQLTPEVPKIINGFLPTIINGASKLITSLAPKFPGMLRAVLPSLTQGVVSVTTELVKVMPGLITSIKDAIPIAVKAIMSKKDELLQAGKDIISAIFPKQFDTDTIKKIVSKGDEIIKKLIDGLLSQDSINAFVEAAPRLIENLVDAIKTVLLGGEQDGEGGLFGAAKEIVVKIGDCFADEQNRKNFLETAGKVIRSLGSGLINILQNGVAPLMVEVARAWAEAFVGEIDYSETAWEIISRLGKAFVNNFLTGGILGKWLDEASRGYTQEIEDNIGVQSTYYASEGMLASSWENAAAKEAYRKYKGYATGFYATQPTWLTHTLVGERGDEVLLPLDSNTTWMDKLADKLSGRMGGGGDIYITVNAPTGNADDIVAALDEALRNRQIAQDRSTGGTGWK